MTYDQSKAIELYLLKAENFDAEIAHNQKNQFESEYHMTETMKNTEYYEGA